MMDNVSNSSPNLGEVGDLAAAPAPAAGFGLEEQSSIIPSMPTMATSEPVSMVAVEEPSVFKEEPSPPSPASTPAAAPSPDQQVFRRSNISRSQRSTTVVIMLSLIGKE